MLRKMFILGCLCALSFKVHSSYDTSFLPKAQLAIDFNLPHLAKNLLKDHIFDIPPMGMQARQLLAEAAYLSRNFTDMQKHLDLLPVDIRLSYLRTLCTWYLHKQILLTPLLLAPQKQKIGEVLARYNMVITEPLYSIRWASFWQRLSHELGENYDAFYQLALDFKVTIDRNALASALTHHMDINWVGTYLFAQKRFHELLLFLRQHSDKFLNTDKVTYLKWLLKTQNALPNTTHEEILNIVANFSDIPLEKLDSVFSEWLACFSSSTAKMEGLQSFYKLYKKRKLLKHCQYIKLLQASCFIESRDFKKAKRILNLLSGKTDKQLQAFLYEVRAQYALWQTPTNYRAAANFLAEAKQHTHNTHKILSYSRIQAECYCLTADYDRAYYTYQEALSKAEGDPLGEILAKEWVLCGILCNATQTEIYEQFEYCNQFHFLTQAQQDSLEFSFLQHQFERGLFSKTLKLARATEIDTPDLAMAVKILIGKCLYRMDEIAQAQEIFKSITPKTLSLSLQKEYFLWESYVLYALRDFTSAENTLQQFFKRVHTNEEIFVQAKWLQAQIFAQNKQLFQAQQTLLNTLPQIDNKWEPLFLFQAGVYTEQMGYEHQSKAIKIFQDLYEKHPEHVLAKDGRIKQGLALINLNQYKLAEAVFSEILPKLTGEQTIWCRYLMQKCRLMAHQTPIAQVSFQLELLLKEEMPLSLRLEITLQLALLYKDIGNVTQLQKILWETCYPLLYQNEEQTFSVNEVFWLSRCLLTLAQNTSEKSTSQQIYRLIIDAQLPVASLVKQFLENE